MAHSPVRSLTGRAGSICKTLTRLYGRQEIGAASDPVDTLVETILSQNTTDANSHRSFLALKKAYPDWDMMLNQKPSRIAAIIRSGGLADLKAERILAALAFVKRERGRLELDFLREMTPAEADRWLAQMKGVGPKTRGIILLFSLGMPSFPVDTHIHRVTRRLGLIGKRVSREKAQEDLAKLVPTSEFFNFHINLIQHGRRVCRARKPSCHSCKVSRYCDFFRKSPDAQA